MIPRDQEGLGTEVSSLGFRVVCSDDQCRSELELLKMEVEALRKENKMLKELLEDSLPWIAFGYSQGFIGAEILGRNIENALKKEKES